MDVKTLKSCFVSCYVRLSRLAAAYFLAFLTVFYFTFYSEHLASRERDSVQGALDRVEVVRKQIEALKKVHQGSRGVVLEITIQQDHYSSRIRQAVEDKRRSQGGEGWREDEELGRAYGQALGIFQEFFRESPEGISGWTISQFGRLEESMYRWKRMESADASGGGRLTKLAKGRAGGGDIVAPSKPARDLAEADSIFAIPTLLSQSLGRFDVDLFPEPVIALKRSEALLLFPKRSVETLEELNSLQAEIVARQRSMEAQERGQIFAVPYIGVSMRQITIFQTGVFATVLLLAVATRYVIQLRALVKHAARMSGGNGRSLADMLTEVAYHSHFLPVLQHGFPQGSRETRGREKHDSANGRAGRSGLRTSALWCADMLARLTEWIYTILFLAVPFGYIAIFYWLASRRGAAERTDVDYFVVPGLFCLVGLVVLLAVNVSELENQVNESSK